MRHNQCRGTPLPFKLSMKSHAATRSRGLVDTPHSSRMCVSYDRFLATIFFRCNKWDLPTFSDRRCCVSIKVAAKSLHYSSSRQYRPQPKLCNRKRFLPWGWHICHSKSTTHGCLGREVAKC